VEFESGKRAKLSTFESGWVFSMNIGCADGQSRFVKVESDFWKGFIESLSRFFQTGEIPVPHKNTLSVIAAREIASQALKQPGEWIYTK